MEAGFPGEALYLSQIDTVLVPRLVGWKKTRICDTHTGVDTTKIKRLWNNLTYIYFSIKYLSVFDTGNILCGLESHVMFFKTFKHAEDISKVFGLNDGWWGILKGLNSYVFYVIYQEAFWKYALINNNINKASLGSWLFIQVRH